MRESAVIRRKTKQSLSNHLKDALTLGGEGHLVQGAVRGVHDDVELVGVNQAANGRPHRGGLLAGGALADVEDDGRGHAEELLVPLDDAGRLVDARANEVVFVARDGRERVVDDYALRGPGCHVHAHDTRELGRDRVNDGSLACV
jgi:hypothetical protein